MTPDPAHSTKRLSICEHSLLRMKNIYHINVLRNRYQFETLIATTFGILSSDGVRYHLSTPNKKTIILLSMGVRCWHELVEYGVWDIMKREYADWISPEIEPDYDISLSFEIEKLPSDAGRVIDFVYLTSDALELSIHYIHTLCFWGLESCFLFLNKQTNKQKMCRGTRSSSPISCTAQAQCTGCTLRARLCDPKGTRS
jgi:hypothetical protein